MSTELIVSDINPVVAIVARGRQALERLQPQMAALEEKEFSSLNVDITVAMSRALGVAPAITAMRARIAHGCAIVDQRAIDELEERAYAVSCANADFETAIAPPQGLAEVVQEAFDARGVLIPVATMLVACNMLKQEQLSGLKRGHGYRDVAEDISALTGVFLRDWARFEGKVPMTRAQLERLQGIAERLLLLLGIRDQAPERTAAAADARIRAFTLLDKAYDESRRAVTFLRWHEGDADAIAPPLRSRPSPRKRADESATGTVATQPAVTQSAPVAPAPPPAPPMGPAPSGLPRSNPYGTA